MCKKPNPVKLIYWQHLHIITVVYPASASLSTKEKNLSSSVYFIPFWKIFKDNSNQEEISRTVIVFRIE